MGRSRFRPKQIMRKQIFFWSLVSALAGFLFGFDTVVISGAEQHIQSLWGLSPGLHGFAMASALYGTVLGSLFGGGPDMQFIDFRPGAADLEPGGVDKAKAMVKALNERPQLKIEVPIATVGELDRPALVEARYLAEVRDAQAAGKANRQKPAAAPDFDQLDPAAQIELLTQVYKTKLGGEPKFPESVSAIKAKPDLQTAKVDFLKQALHEHIAIADSDLTALGQQRAMAVQQALLTDTQVDPARVFLVANDKAKAQDGKVRLELSLQ